MPAVGVDLGGTKVLAGLVDDDGRVLCSHKAPTPQAGLAAVLDVVVAAIDEVAAGHEPVGVGVPGMVLDDGTVTRAPNLVGFDQPVRLADQLNRRLGRPVVVDNDVNVGAVAEHQLGAGRGWHELVAVFVGTGVGGGLILDGRLRRGPGGIAGEIGHLTVHPGGEPCACGGRGHLEAYAGRAGLERRARAAHAGGRSTLLVERAGTGPMRSKVVARALADGDELAHELVAEAADALAVAIGNAAALLDVHHFVIGGGLGERLGAPFLEQVRRSALFGGFGSAAVELRLAERLDDAGLVGAAMLAIGRLGAAAQPTTVDAG